MTDHLAHTPQTLSTEVGKAFINSAPPVAAWAVTPNTVVAVVTVIYVIFQTLYLLRRWYLVERRRLLSDDD